MRLHFFLILFIASVSLSCESKKNKFSAEQSFSALQAMKGNYQLEFDNSSFLYWEQKDSLLVGTAYAIQNADTILTEFHTMQLVGDSLLYNVMVTNNEIPLTIDYSLQGKNGNQFQFSTTEREFPKELTYKIDENQLLVTRKGIIAESEQELTEVYKKIK